MVQRRIVSIHGTCQPGGDNRQLAVSVTWMSS